MPWSDFFVSPDNLFQQLGTVSVKLVDGSWYLDPNRQPEEEFRQAHLPGAVFFDIDKVADQTTSLPHMLSSPADFALAAGLLGITESDEIVVYDRAGLSSAARVWWTFRIMGARSVRILEGGFPAWQTAGYPIESGMPHIEERVFRTDFKASAVISLSELIQDCADQPAKILDARPAARFFGQSPEPRPGLRSGHMPGAVNLPSSELVENGRLKNLSALKAIFDSFDLNKDDQLVTTCGSGVTASILTLGLAVAGFEKTRLYDGSWAEWGAHPDTEVTCQ